MRNEKGKVEILKVILGAVFTVVVVGISFGSGWYAKELSVIKQNQLEIQEAIEGIQDNNRKITGKIAALEQGQLNLREWIEDVQNNTNEFVSNIAEMIEQNQLKLQRVIENVRENNRELTANIAVLEKNQLKMRDLIEQISKEVLPSDSLEVISIEPAFPTALKTGEKLRVKISYCIDSTDSAQIWARPYTNGRSTPGYRAHGSPCHKRGVGEVEGYFFFDEPTIVDEVRIRMVDCKTKKTLDTISHEIDARWIGSKASKNGQAHRQSGFPKDRPERIVIDVDNPDGEAGWKDEYVVELKSTSNISRRFGVNWYRPHRVESISAEKPDFINTLPEFRHNMQQYLTLRLGNAENNQIVGVMDFREPDMKHFPFDLYLDRDRDGDLAEDFIENRRYTEGVHIPYNDGTTENYALHLYSCSNEPVGVMYQSRTGRYGILKANQKRIQILVIDNSGNGVFNDDDDAILLDWDLDGKLDGSHQANEELALYSLLKLHGASYRVAEFDAPGRCMVLRRQRTK